jgi:hypothetical protein
MDVQPAPAARLLGLLGLCLAAATACAGLLTATACAGKTPLGPTVRRADRFTLAPGAIAVVEGEGVRVEFVGVVGDSRCPADVVCVRLGEAIVHLRVYDASITAYELRTGSADLGSVTHRDLRIELVDVQPYPFSSRRIAPADYRATLVTR